MPAKAPIYLKPINSKKGKKCRLRDMLSPDMISPPLGDFRHTVHIGRGGDRDTFGDMSFLQGNFELLPGKAALQPPFGLVQSDYLRTKSSSDASASFAETPSPVLKNAISLPAIGGGQALTLPMISCGGGGGGVFPLHHPPEPLEDIVGGASSSASRMNPDHRMQQELEIMQMDELLRSMEVFKPDSKPDVLLDLAPEEKPEEEEEEEPAPISKAVSKANRANRGERGRGEKPSYYINGGGGSSNKSSFKANGSLYSSASSDSYDSYDGGKGHAVYDGSPGSGGGGNRGFAGNDHHGDCSNGYGRFGGDIVALGYEKELDSDCVGGGSWADRDSGVEEGGGGGGRIICDFDLEFVQSGVKGGTKRSASQDSLRAQITGSLLSLELDLGPSILDDVLGIMNQPHAAKSRP